MEYIGINKLICKEEMKKRLEMMKKTLIPNELCVSFSLFSFFHDDKLIWAMVFGFSS